MAGIAYQGRYSKYVYLLFYSIICYKIFYLAHFCVLGTPQVPLQLLSVIDVRKDNTGTVSKGSCLVSYLSLSLAHFGGALMGPGSAVLLHLSGYAQFRCINPNSHSLQFPHFLPVQRPSPYVHNRLRRKGASSSKLELHHRNWSAQANEMRNLSLPT